MQRLLAIRNNEKGSTVVIVVLILVLLTLIGIAVMNTTSVDTQMAGQHRRHKMTFYGADGGTEIACELLEQNIGCPDGFTTNTDDPNIAVIGLDPAVFPPPFALPLQCPDQIGSMQGVRVNSLNFYQNPPINDPAVDSASSDLFYPANCDEGCPGNPHTNLTVGEATTVYAQGSAVQMVAGYEGKGKGAGGGGGLIYYTVFSQRIESNDNVTVRIRWRHAIGQEGGCNY